MTIPITGGTITLKNGSNEVFGNETGWQTALLVGGIIYPEAANGNALPIRKVESDTRIIAATKWKGADGTYSYAIIRDTADAQQTVRNTLAVCGCLFRHWHAPHLP